MSRIVTIALATGIAAASLVLPPAQAGTPKDVLVIAGNMGSMITLDPAAINESFTADLMRSVCDSLVATHEEDASKLVPGVAESWSVSDDLRTYTFKIREGLKFPSGNPVTAHDVLWSVQRTIKLNLANAQRLREWDITDKNVDDVFAVADDVTLIVRPTRAWAPSLFPYAFTDFRVAPVLDRKEILRHEVSGDLGNKWLTTNTACLGPFQVKTWRPQEVWILERNDTWWRHPVAVQRIIIRHVPEAGAQRLLLEKGDADIALNLDPADYQAIQDNPDTRLVFSPGLDIEYVAFNMKDPRFKNLKVLQAFRHLFDYDLLEKTVLRHYGVIRQSPVPVGVFGALPADFRPFTPDLEKAKRLLAEAGFPDGFEAELITANVSPRVDIAQHLQQRAAKVGVTLKVTQMIAKQVLERMRKRHFEIVLAGYGFNYPDANNIMLRHAYNPDNSDEAKNTISVAWRAAWDPGESFNNTIRAAQVEKDPQKRIQMYRELQRLHVAESPLIYLVQETNATGYHKGVKRLKQNIIQVFYATAEKH